MACPSRKVLKCKIEECNAATSLPSCHTGAIPLAPMSLTEVWKPPFYQRWSQEEGTSSSGSLCFDWLLLLRWARTLFSLGLRRRCCVPRTAPVCRYSQQSSARSCWAYSRGEHCYMVWRRRCRCRSSPPCWGGQGRGQLGPPRNPRLLALLRQTSARRCGCWKRCWIVCCCWSGWSTESPPDENKNGPFRPGNEQATGWTIWWRFWPSSVWLGTPSQERPVWVFSSAPLHQLAP